MINQIIAVLFADVTTHEKKYLKLLKFKINIVKKIVKILSQLAHVDKEKLKHVYYLKNKMFYRRNKAEF